MRVRRYDTPEEAARGDIPARFARALGVRISPSGNSALVVLATNELPTVEPYVVFCERVAGRWETGSGGNGNAGEFSHTDGESVRFVYDDEAPAEASSVIVEFEGEHSVPVDERFALFTAWNPRGHEWPNVVAWIDQQGKRHPL